MDTAERDALLTLILTPGLGHVLIGRCLEAFGSATATLDAGAEGLAKIHGVSEVGAAKFSGAFDHLREDGTVDRELAAVAAQGIRLLAWDDAEYPRLLRLIPDPPVLLWMRGQLIQNDALSLAIVGSRRCSGYGREQAERFAYQAAQAGLNVVSGGAYGIDAAAHRAALQAGGRTIAVLGSGLANPYPTEHIELFDQITDSSDSRGAVLSEWPMDSPPLAEHFPRRNRIISGLSLGTLVIEAAQRSGALITARLCVEDHGRELMAVPGRADSKTSAGCHQVIREGWATLVTNIADVLDALGEAGQMLKADVAVNHGGETSTVVDTAFSDPQRQIITVLSGPRSLDQIVVASGLPVAQVQSELTMLEIRGAIKRRNGQFVLQAQGV